MSNSPASPSHPKPVQRCVDINLLRSWIGEPALQRISLPAAWEIIRRQFCSAVIARGVCPIDCERCRDEITDLFRLEKAEKPAALLSWLAKDHSARWIEKLLAAEKAEEQFPALETPEQHYRGLFLSKDPPNLFVELLKDYEEI